MSTAARRASLPLALEPLRHRDFRLLWVGQTISYFGSNVYLVALPFQILALGGGPVEVGLPFGIQTASLLVVLLFAGPVVDRVPRRSIILVADLSRGVAMTLVAVMGYLGVLRLEHLYALSAIFGAAGAFFLPAMRAILPELIPPDVLTQGNALRAQSRQLARLTGPIVGGLMVAAFGAALAFLVNGASFFVSFAAFSQSRPTPLESRQRRELLVEARAGLAYVLSMPWLWISIFGGAVINAALFGPVIVGLPILVSGVLLLDARAYGAIFTAIGFGEIVGGLVAGQLRLDRMGVVFYLLLALAGLTVASFGLFLVLPLLLLIGMIHGLSLVIASALWSTMLQRNVPLDLLGRVSSVDEFGGNLLAPIVPVVFGALIGVFGAVPVFVAGGLLAAALSLGAILLAPIRSV